MFDALRGPKWFYVTLSSALKADVSFWLAGFDLWNGRRLWHPCFSFAISSDASRSAVAAWVNTALNAA
jgi:hypothetical protein